MQLSVVANQGGLEAIGRKSDCRRSALGGITPCSVLWWFFPELPAAPHRDDQDLRLRGSLTQFSSSSLLSDLFLK